MNLVGRLGILLLAIVPVVWGLCPCAMTGYHCCAAATACAVEGGGDAGGDSCPCCPDRRDGPDRPAPRAPCDGCPLMEASDGVTPAQGVPDLPPPPAQPMGFADLPAPVFEVGWIDASEVAPAMGRPPDLLSSVVLVI